MSTEHNFARGQRLTIVDDEQLEGQSVEVLALLEHRCEAHQALCYGCDMNGTHLSICEHQLAPLSTKQKRSLN